MKALMGLMLLCGIVCPASAEDTRKEWGTFSHDFTTGLPPKFFDTKSVAPKQTKHGLQHAATSNGNNLTYNVFARFSLEGDFEIEVGFRDLNTQSEGKIAGMMFGVDFEDDYMEAVRARYGLTNQKPTNALVTITNEEAGKKYRSVMKPSQLTSGRIRVVRTGAQVQLLEKGENEDKFRLVSSKEVTDKKSTAEGIRLAVVSQGQSSVSVTWTDLRVSAEKLWYHPVPDESRVLYTMNADGTELKRVGDLLVDMQNQGSPAWSNDGQQIVYDTWPGKNDWHVGLMNSDGTNNRILGRGCIPSFSPDADYLAYSQTGVMRRDIAGTFNETIDRSAWGSQWSPDGQWVAYKKGRNIYLLNNDTDNVQPLLSDEQSATISAIYWHLDWSHDSKSLAFRMRQKEQENGFDIAVADVGNFDGFKVVLKDAYFNGDLAWAPDNKRVLFSTSTSNKLERPLVTVHRDRPNEIEELPGQPENFLFHDCDWSAQNRIVFTATKVTPPVNWADVQAVQELGN